MCAACTAHTVEDMSSPFKIPIRQLSRCPAKLDGARRTLREDASSVREAGEAASAVGRVASLLSRLERRWPEQLDDHQLRGLPCPIARMRL